MSGRVDGYGFEYLMNCRMSRMHNLSQFPFEPQDTDEGWKPRGVVEEDKRKR